MCSKNASTFKVLPLRYSATSTECHDLYFKEHSVRIFDESKPNGRTLFVLNVPPYVNAKALKTAFKKADGIVNVIIENNINEHQGINCGFKVGYIIFNTKENLVKALKLPALDVLSTEETPLKTGLTKWITHYNNSIYNPEKLSKEISCYVAQMDNRDKKADQKGKNQVDDEGWTVVTRKGRNPGLARKESVEMKMNEKLQRGSKKKELKNFYSFQIRESKMKNIADLRRNYEEAKKKVSVMKCARRFKPF